MYPSFQGNYGHDSKYMEPSLANCRQWGQIYFLGLKVKGSGFKGSKLRLLASGSWLLAKSVQPMTDRQVSATQSERRAARSQKRENMAMNFIGQCAQK
jgi:hypothetical protein